MVPAKKLTDFTSLFSQHDFKKKDDINLNWISKMNESNSIKLIDKIGLSEQTKFRLKTETIGTENYFHQEINQRISCSKKLNKYVTTFHYIDKMLIVLSATSFFVS